MFFKGMFFEIFYVIHFHEKNINLNVITFITKRGIVCNRKVTGT